MRYGLNFGLAVVVVACCSSAHADDIVKYIPGASSADGSGCIHRPVPPGGVYLPSR